MSDLSSNIIRVSPLSCIFNKDVQIHFLRKYIFLKFLQKKIYMMNSYGYFCNKNPQNRLFMICMYSYTYNTINKYIEHNKFS